jgi:hypothetical protein
MNYLTLTGAIIISIISFWIINYFPNIFVTRILNKKSERYIIAITTLVFIAVLNMAVVTIFVRRNNAIYYYAGALAIIIFTTIKNLLDIRKKQ